MSKFRKMWIAICGICVVALAAAGVAWGVDGGPKTAASGASDSLLEATFPVLDEAPVAEVPESLERAARADSPPQLSFDPTTARVVDSPGANAGPWYAVKVAFGLCLYTSDGAGACTSAANAEQGGLFYFTMPPPPPVAMTNGKPGQIVGSDAYWKSAHQRFAGLAPAGVTTVTTRHTDGPDVSTPVLADGAYAFDAGAQVSALVFSGPSIASFSTQP